MSTYHKAVSRADAQGLPANMKAAGPSGARIYWALCLIHDCDVLERFVLEVLVGVMHHDHVTVHHQHIVAQPYGPVCTWGGTIFAES